MRGSRRRSTFIRRVTVVSYAIEYFDMVTIHFLDMLKMPGDYQGELFGKERLAKRIEEAPDFIRDILQLEGVKTVRITGFEIHLVKSSKINCWEEIIPSTMAIISKYGGCNGQMSEVADWKALEKEAFNNVANMVSGRK